MNYKNKKLGWLANNKDVVIKMAKMQEEEHNHAIKYHKDRVKYYREYVQYIESI